MDSGPGRSSLKRPRPSSRHSDEISDHVADHDLDSSPTAGRTDTGGQQQQHVLRRACNGCRQQKLRCDVIHEPFAACSRCRRMDMECKIDSRFKRVEKRSKFSAMELEITELKRLLAESQAQRPKLQRVDDSDKTPVQQSDTFDDSPVERNRGALNLSGTNMESCLRIRQDQRVDSAISTSRELDGIRISEDRIEHLFNLFFRHYHPFLPFLDRHESPGCYFSASPLLAWTIVAVASRRFTAQPTLLDTISGPLLRLLWTTIAQAPHNYHTVKALCILCMWPLPSTSAWKDPSYMFCGIMVQISTQTGLHMPANAQDFTKHKVELKEKDIKDRLRTWIACNIAAQCTATSFGQHPLVFDNWALEQSLCPPMQYEAPVELRTQLAIAKFCQKVTTTFYGNHLDPYGLINADAMRTMAAVLADDLDNLESRLGHNLSSYNLVYIQAAKLHLFYFVFFDTSVSKSYHQDLVKLSSAIATFLQTLVDLEKSSTKKILDYVTDYVLQMMISAAFALYRLLNSFFAKYIDIDRGIHHFSWVVAALKRMSVREHDRASRLAVVLAELWRASGTRSEAVAETDKGSNSTLHLQVRCRMSMSHMFDSVWRWRQEFERTGQTTLHAPETDSIVAANAPLSSPNQSPITVMNTFSSSSTRTGDAVAEGLRDSTCNEAIFDDMGTFDGLMEGFDDFPYDFSGMCG